MDRLTAWVTFVARWTAIAGGIVLVFLTVTTVASISGRALSTMANLPETGGLFTFAYPLMRAIGGVAVSLGAQPISGDYELIEAGTAFAVFAFLPWCQLNRGHATVEVLVNLYPTVMNRSVDLIADLLMLTVAVVIAWRQWLGLLDKHSYGETTFILQAPVWWGYAASMIGAVVFILVAAFCVVRSARDLRARRTTVTSGAQH